MNISINRELERLIPALSNEEYEGLEADIVDAGKCHDALKVWEKSKDQFVLIDGHNRYKICRKHKIDNYRVTVLKFDDLGTAKVWIIRNQLNRRNITAFQRTELALALKETLAAQGQKNRSRFVNIDKTETINTREMIAAQANVSTGTVHKVEKVLEQADAKTVKAARNGAMSIDAAYKTIKKPARKPRLQFGGAFQITVENITNPNQIRRGRGSLAFKLPEDSQEAIDPVDLMDSIRALVEEKGLEIL